MALLALIAILLGLPVLTLTADSGTTAPSSSSARPTLKLVRMDPLTVAGRGFQRGERVAVSANGKRKVVVAGVYGGFIVSFRGVGSCGAQIVARGSTGSRATVSLNFANVHCLEPQGAVGNTAQAAAKPTVRVLAYRPLTVRGDAFAPGERVRLFALGSLKRVSRTTTANQRGVFKAAFAGLSDRCTPLVVSAVGSMGSRASAKVVRRPCNPPRLPPPPR